VSIENARENLVAKTAASSSINLNGKPKKTGTNIYLKLRFEEVRKKIKSSFFIPPIPYLKSKYA